MESEKSKEWTLEDNLIACAQRFSQKIEEAFVFEFRAGYTFIKESFAVSPPTEDRLKELATMQFDMMFDYFITTAMVLLSDYGSESEEFEKVIHDMIKEKFVLIRGRNAAN